MSAASLLCVALLLLVGFIVDRLKTPLHVAADKSHFELMDILLKHGAKVMRWFCGCLCLCPM